MHLSSFAKLAKVRDTPLFAFEQSGVGPYRTSTATRVRVVLCPGTQSPFPTAQSYPHM